MAIFTTKVSFFLILISVISKMFRSDPEPELAGPAGSHHAPPFSVQYTVSDVRRGSESLRGNEELFVQCLQPKERDVLQKRAIFLLEDHQLFQLLLLFSCILLLIKKNSRLRDKGYLVFSPLPCVHLYLYSSTNTYES